MVEIDINGEILKGADDGFSAFGLALQKAAQSLSVSLSPFGRHQKILSDRMGRLHGRLRRAGFPVERIDEVDYLCDRLGICTGMSKLDWLELTSDRSSLGFTPDEIVGVMVRSIPDHYRFVRMPDESLASFEAYLFRYGLVDDPRGRWAYQKAVFGKIFQMCKIPLKIFRR